MDILKWLEEWYHSNCDGDWEHQYGIKINSLDNPGWEVVIDLSEMSRNFDDIEYKLVENNEFDWIGYSLKDNVFRGVGDQWKLKKLIELFKSIIEN